MVGLPLVLYQPPSMTSLLACDLGPAFGILAHFAVFLRHLVVIQQYCPYNNGYSSRHETFTIDEQWL